MLLTLAHINDIFLNICADYKEGLFMTSELKRAFEIGFLLYIPFMLIDIVS